MQKLKSVAEWVNERGLHVEDIIDRTVLERRVIQAIVDGQYTPSPQQRLRIATSLGVGVEDICWYHAIETENMYGHGPQFGRSP